jgi:centrosomal protein CEP78
MLDHMSGLRRVTLNSNPLIADRGATFLAEVLEADLWIKGKFFLSDFSSIRNK